MLGRFYWPAQHGLDVTGHQIGRDFINNWAGPQLAFSGRLSTLFDLDGYVEAISKLFGQTLPFHNWGYPPFTLIFFWPLGQLPYFVALAIWTVLFFAIYAAVAAQFVGPKQKAYVVLALVCAPASIVNAVGGQNGFVTAALFLGGVLALERRPVLAGVLFGLLTSKPQLGLVLPLALLALGAWRTIVAACVTTAILIGASVLAFGFEPWRHYLIDTSAFQVSLLQNFRGFYPVMMTSVLAEVRTLGFPFSTASIVQAAVSVPVAIATAWAVRRTSDARRRAFILASAAPLITPYAFNYDLTALTAALTWRLVEDADQPWSVKDFVFRMGWLLPIVAMSFNMVGLGIAPVVLLAVFAISVGEVVQDSPRTSDGVSASALG